MYFEKITKFTWRDYITDVMTKNNAPIDAIDAAVDAWNDIKLPQRATAGSAGYDFYAPMEIMLPPGMNAVIPTGIKVNLDEPTDIPGTVSKNLYVLQIYPRSSLGFKYSMTLANTVGIIDRDYFNNEKNEGHILISITNGLTFEGCPIKVVPDIRTGREMPTVDLDAEETKRRFINVPKGGAFAQGIITRVFTVFGDKPVSEERTGGIGSTDASK